MNASAPPALSLPLQTPFPLPRLPSALLATLPALLLPVAPSVDAAEASNLRILAVEVVEVRSQPGFEKTRSFMGRVEAARSSSLGFELAGTVTRLTVDEGDHVGQGQLIAELDTQRLEAREAELIAGLDQAQANEQLAEVTLRRNEELVESRATSEQQLDEAKNTWATAKAQVKLIEAQIRQVRVDLGKSMLQAPFDGVVSRRFVDEGSIVSAVTSGVDLLVSSNLESELGVSQQAIQSMDQGETFSLQSKMGPLEAVVERVLSQRNEQTRTVDEILRVKSSQGHLRDGDLIPVPVNLTTSERGYWIPRQALTESERGLWACYVAVPTDQSGILRLERRQLELLHVRGADVYARGALREKDLVVRSGLQRLSPDQHVRLKAKSLTRN